MLFNGGRRSTLSRRTTYFRVPECLRERYLFSRQSLDTDKGIFDENASNHLSSVQIFRENPRRAVF